MNAQQSDRYFFTGLAIWAFLLTAIGFSPTFYLRPAEQAPLPFYIILHGVPASIWVLFFLLQANLISAQQRKLHATLGLLSIPLCLAVAATGAVVALGSIEHHGNPIWGVCLSLGLEPTKHLPRVHAQLDDLKRDLTDDRLALFGHVNNAHAAFADFLEHLVAADHRAWTFGQRPSHHAGQILVIGEKLLGPVGILQHSLYVTAQAGVSATHLRQISSAFGRVGDLPRVQKDVILRVQFQHTCANGRKKRTDRSPCSAPNQICPPIARVSQMI